MFETSSHGGRQSSGFLRLSLELRNEIYSLIFGRGAVNVGFLQFEVDSWTRSMWEKPPDSLYAVEEWFPKRKMGILSVSRQISEEALNILYGNRLFLVYINGGGQDKMLNFGNANIRRIRNLRLVAQPMGVCYGNNMKIDSLVWAPLLADLNRLCLVAQQPLRAGYYYNAPTLQENMREWVTWLEPILQYLGRNIAKATNVEVDHNDLLETDQLVQKYFPSGYQKVRTVNGDRIFERGQFSRESAYWDDDSGTNFADGGIGDDWSD